MWSDHNCLVIVMSSEIDCDIIIGIKTEQVRHRGNDRRFYHHLWIHYVVRNKIMHVLSWRTVSAPTRVLFLCLFPSLLHNSGNKHKNNPLVSTETVRHLSTYIILYQMAKAIMSLMLYECWKNTNHGTTLINLFIGYLRDWSRSGGSYGNNTLVICCPAGTSLELRSRDVPAPDNKSRGCCCRNSLLTVINPDYNMTIQRYITHIYVKIRSKSPPNGAMSPTCLHCDVTHLSLTTGVVDLHIPSRRVGVREEHRQARKTVWPANAGRVICRCALGTSRRRTTNHEGVVAVTPSWPWSIPIITWPYNVILHIFTSKYVQNHHQTERCRQLASIVTSRISP